MLQKEENQSVRKKSWDDFRSTGLLLFVNSFLHIFGWALIYDDESDSIYPARTTYRGFAEPNTSAAYEKLAKYLKDNANEIYLDTIEK